MRRKRAVYGVCAMHNYAGYGMTADRAKALLKECRAGKHTELVRAAAQQAAPGVEEWIVSSIVDGKSLHDMEIRWELGEAEVMPCCRNSFYAYRKFTLAILDNMLSVDKRVK
ncbi:hypothetical protein NSB25_22310 [Acetatifactor muris]|uniref:Uncharacterized protein n=1 Tax=Acetatifactor muris TaxID=879566 RepID=A0A2K4ZMF1_9FIRM|nr:hypothetical protein [Acetatifactor muris]MCR2049987.1 hypothetical protein [Acetatifactor muris]SOY31663.1 hypothetical protein AMURIS_04408 [Acetatifactor muris]